MVYIFFKSTLPQNTFTKMSHCTMWHLKVIFILTEQHRGGGTSVSGTSWQCCFCTQSNHWLEIKNLLYLVRQAQYWMSVTVKVLDEWLLVNMQLLAPLLLCNCNCWLSGTVASLNINSSSICPWPNAVASSAMEHICLSVCPSVCLILDSLLFVWWRGQRNGL